jgi:hypothetical protein
MNNKPSLDLDNELAELTDMLLAGKPTTASPENEAHAEVVRQLHTMMSKNRQPDAAFRSQLTRKINTEWDMAFKQQQPRLSMASRLSLRGNRMMMMAASLVVVLIFVMLLLSTSGIIPQGNAQSGATVGAIDTIPIVAIIVVVTIAGVFVWLRRR